MKNLSPKKSSFLKTSSKNPPVPLEIDTKLIKTFTEEQRSTNQHSSEESEQSLSNTNLTIIGTVFVGALLLLVLILVTIWYCKKRKRKGNWFET